jgi:predicted outer membrane repeat protein
VVSGRRLGRSGVVGALAACALLSIGAAQAAAATFTVTTGSDSGAGSLRQAITDAEANANEPVVDQIQITFTGNINLASTLPLIDTPMTISGTGASNVNVTRDSGASGPFTFFAVLPPSGDTVTIQDLRISGARAPGFAGGGVDMGGLGNLIIDSVVFSDNQSDQGGGVFYTKGFTSIRNSTLTGNAASFGGAILASKFGTDVGTGEVVNSTITGNSATEFGGGIYIGQGEIQVESSTIVDNTADSDDSSPSVEGGGTYSANLLATGFSVANTLYADNHDGTTTPVDSECGGDYTSFGYNLREANNPGECTGFTATGDLVDADATMLGSLAANGGPTPTIALLAGNPAINAGNPTTPGGAFPVCPATDQRRLLRVGVAGRCDIGAFELNAVSFPSGGGGGGTTTPPGVTPTPPASVLSFDLAGAIKHCKKKFRKGPKRKKCIKRAKKHAVA